MLPERATHACMFAHVHEKVRVILSVLQQAIYPCALAFFFFFSIERRLVLPWTTATVKHGGI